MTSSQAVSVHSDHCWGSSVQCHIGQELCPVEYVRKAHAPALPETSGLRETQHAALTSPKGNPLLTGVERVFILESYSLGSNASLTSDQSGYVTSLDFRFVIN